TPASTPTTHAPIARAIPRHNGPADMAAWRIAEVDEILHRVRGVIDAAIHKPGARFLRGLCTCPLAVRQAALRWSCFSLDRSRGRLRSRLSYTTFGERLHILEQRVLASGNEADLQPAEDVIHHRLGNGNLGVAGKAGGFEAGVLEFFAQEAQRDTVLQSQ